MTKKYQIGISFFALTLSTFFNYSGFADTDSTASVSNESQVSDPTTQRQETRYPNKQFEIGPQLYYFDYKESFSTPGLKSEERGIVPGLALSYSLLPRSRAFFLYVSGSFNSTDIHYDGSLQNGTPHQSTSGLQIAKLDTTLGFAIARRSSFDIGPYAGVNFRVWNRELDKGKANGYQEVYMSFWVPVGVRWNVYPNDRFQFAVDASVGIPVASYFEVNVGNHAAANSLDTNLMWKVQTPVTVWFGKKLGLTVSPFFEAFSYSASLIGSSTNYSSGLFYPSTIIEPDSRTFEYGTQIKAALRL